MKIVNNKLSIDTIVIKPRSGTYNDGKLKINKADYALYVGGFKFPLSVLNKLSFNPDGLVGMVDGKLAVTLNNFWHTINIVSFEVDADLGSGQQAVYTIQHGERSTVLTNLAEQVTALPHEKDKPVTITAVNYATGAITTDVKYPAPGQAYKISSVSSSHVEGALTTTGGELISGGELKTICVRKDLDVASATKTYWSAPFQLASHSIGSVAPTAEEVQQGYVSTYNDVMLGLGFFNGDSIGQNMHRIRNFIASPVKLLKVVDSMSSAAPVIQPNLPFKAPDNGLYTVFIDTGLTQVTADNFARLEWGSDAIIHNDLDTTVTYTGFKVTLQKDKTYIINYNMAPLDVQVSTTTPVHQPNSNPNSYTGSMLITMGIQREAVLIGPIDEICVDYQTVDTRYSYTTPVITTDTRRTVNEIALTVTPLN